MHAMVICMCGACFTISSWAWCIEIVWQLNWWAWIGLEMVCVSFIVCVAQGNWEAQDYQRA